MPDGMSREKGLKQQVFAFFIDKDSEGCYKYFKVPNVIPYSGIA
jgi:hypothetical protein